LRSFTKHNNLKTIGKKLKVFNTINDHLNNKIAISDHYIHRSRNVKREKDKKQYYYNIEPELKVKSENEIKKNKIISD